MVALWILNRVDLLKVNFLFDLKVCIGHRKTLLQFSTLRLDYMWKSIKTINFLFFISFMDKFTMEQSIKSFDRKTACWLILSPDLYGFWLNKPQSFSTNIFLIKR